jgi:acetyltransferase-like isoleucine patch superfamily enzyme
MSIPKRNVHEASSFTGHSAPLDSTSAHDVFSVAYRPEGQKRSYRMSGSRQRRVIMSRLATIRACMRFVSFAPLQSLRLLGLASAGVKMGSDIVLKPGVEVLAPRKLTIGSHTNIGRYVHLDSRGGLTIGDNVNISDEVAIWTAEHDIQSPTFAYTTAPVVIGARAWLCFRSIILAGITLGEGCVVASGAVVTKDVAPFTVVAGIPAKVIGNRNRHLTYQLGNPKVESKTL